MSNKVWTEFEDLVAIKISDELIDGADNLTSTSRLIVNIDASHAGVLNGNMRMYRPDMVKQGAFTMIDKPFIKHHDEASDPIGVVIDAQYVNIASDEFKAAHKSFMSDKFWRGEETPFEDVLNLSPQGLGKLVAKAQVTDIDAIEKILDKRFMGVSIKFRTDQMRCSCGKDKASMMAMFMGDEEDEETCSHMSGETVDGVHHFNVAGRLSFPHLSVVNEPADPKAKITTTDCIDMQIYNGTDSEKTYSKYIVETEDNDKVVEDDNDSPSETPDTSQEGQQMDRNELLNDSIVKELLEEARTEGKDSRQSEVDELKAAESAALAAVEHSDGLFSAAQDEVEGLTRTLVEELAASLLDMRTSRGVVENAEEVLATLTKRTISSLRDSIEDERNMTVEEAPVEEEVVEEPAAQVDDPGISPEGEDSVEEDDDVVDVPSTRYNSWMV